MRVIRAREYVTRPWKNGGGTTREIVTFPEGSGYDTFEWLISAAHVGGDGPFSIFPEVDRSMAILSGAAMTLHGLGAAPVALTPETAPYAFAGDVPVTATLANGPVEDLNLMTRRGTYRHAMRRVAMGAPVALLSRGVLAVFAERGAVRAKSASGAVEAAEGDTVLCESDVVLSGSSGAQAIVMEIWRA
jgi:uncharacterized protein